jgi:hypothetical protein
MTGQDFTPCTAGIFEEDGPSCGAAVFFGKKIFEFGNFDCHRANTAYHGKISTVRLEAQRDVRQTRMVS